MKIDDYYNLMKIRIAKMDKNEAIDFLKDCIFMDEMQDFKDFDYCNACEKLIKELKEMV